jgi:hypothetical protein
MEHDAYIQPPKATSTTVKFTSFKYYNWGESISFEAENLVKFKEELKSLMKNKS